MLLVGELLKSFFYWLIVSACHKIINKPIGRASSLNYQPFNNIYKAIFHLNFIPNLLHFGEILCKDIAFFWIVQIKSTLKNIFNKFALSRKFLELKHALSPKCLEAKYTLSVKLVGAKYTLSVRFTLCPFVGWHPTQWTMFWTRIKFGANEQTKGADY